MAVTEILFSNGETETFNHDTQDSLSLQAALYSRNHGHCTITEMREAEEDEDEARAEV